MASFFSWAKAETETMTHNAKIPVIFLIYASFIIFELKVNKYWFMSILRKYKNLLIEKPIVRLAIPDQSCDFSRFKTWRSIGKVRSLSDNSLIDAHRND